jgi:hypothetical protein
MGLGLDTDLVEALLDGAGWAGLDNGGLVEEAFGTDLVEVHHRRNLMEVVLGIAGIVAVALADVVVGH